MSRIRLVPAVLLALAVTACGTGNSTSPDTTKTGSTPTGTVTTGGATAGPTAGTSTAPPASGVAATGAPAGSAGDPCQLLTAADIKTIKNQNVVSVRRLPPSTDSDGTSQQCVFTTDGKGASGASLGAMGALLGGLTGGSAKLPTQLPGAGIGVTLVTLPKPISFDDEQGPTPPQVHKISGLGDVAVVIAFPAGQTLGGAAIGGIGKKGVYIMDIEGATVSQADLEALLRAAMARL